MVYPDKDVWINRRPIIDIIPFDKNVVFNCMQYMEQRVQLGYGFIVINMIKGLVFDVDYSLANKT